MKCANCNKQASVEIPRVTGNVPVCLDCYIKWQDVHIRSTEALRRQMEAFMGTSSVTFPSSQMPSFIPQSISNYTFNNIQVSDSEVGVLNAASIKQVDSTLTVIKESTNPELAEAIRKLSEAVIKSEETDKEVKNRIIELLGALSEEAVVPDENRKKEIGRVLLDCLNNLFQNLPTLIALWEKVQTEISQLF